MEAYFYYPAMLETMARHALTKHNPQLTMAQPKAVPIEEIIEKTYGLRIEYQYLTANGRELGRMIFDDGYTPYYNRDIMDYALMKVEPGTILIDATLLESEQSYGRMRFTLAHELGHYILHQRLYSGTKTAAALHKDDTDSYDENAVEWQANFIAKAILMPAGQVKRAFYSLRPVCKVRKDFICQLAQLFEVSKQAMEIRLKELALLS